MELAADEPEFVVVVVVADEVEVPEVEVSGLGSTKSCAVLR